MDESSSLSLPLVVGDVAWVACECGASGNLLLQFGPSGEAVPVSLATPEGGGPGRIRHLSYSADSMLYTVIANSAADGGSSTRWASLDGSNWLSADVVINDSGPIDVLAVGQFHNRISILGSGASGLLLMDSGDLGATWTEIEIPDLVVGANPVEERFVLAIAADQIVIAVRDWSGGVGWQRPDGGTWRRISPPTMTSPFDDQYIDQVIRVGERLIIGGETQFEVGDGVLLAPSVAELTDDGWEAAVLDENLLVGQELVGLAEHQGSAYALTRTATEGGSVEVWRSSSQGEWTSVGPAAVLNALDGSSIRVMGGPELIAFGQGDDRPRIFASKDGIAWVERPIPDGSLPDATGWLLGGCHDDESSYLTGGASVDDIYRPIVLRMNNGLIERVEVGAPQSASDDIASVTGCVVLDDGQLVLTANSQTDPNPRVVKLADTGFEPISSVAPGNGTMLATDGTRVFVVSFQSESSRTLVSVTVISSTDGFSSARRETVVDTTVGALATSVWVDESGVIVTINSGPGSIIAGRLMANA